MYIHLETGVTSGSVLDLFPALAPDITSVIKFHELFSLWHLMSFVLSPDWTSHSHISGAQPYLWGSFLFFLFSTRAFPLPCRPMPSFGPVIPVNLMLKRSLQQSITAKTTELLTACRVSAARADRREPALGNAHSVSPSRVNRGREMQTDALGADWQERAWLLAR